MVATLEVIVAEGNNPMQDKVKRNIFDNPKGEKSCKMKEYPILMKEALEETIKRKQRI